MRAGHLGHERRWAIPLLLASMAGTAHAQDHWAMPAAKRADVVGTAARDRLGDPWVKAEGAQILKKQFARWDELEATEAASYAIQTSAMLQAYGFNYPARVISGYALFRAPDDDVALGNYAAISCYPPFLRAAVAASPKSAVAQTNLGSCAMSQQRWDVARAAYEKALELKPGHVNALLGMGQWWMRQGDVNKAAEYYFRAKRFRVLRKKQAKGSAEEVPPPELRRPPRDRFGAGGDGAAPADGGETGGTEHVTDTTLRLPDLPRWPGPDAFLASAKARKPLGVFYGERVGAGLKLGIDAIKADPLKQLRDMEARFAAMSPAEREQAALESSLERSWDDTEVMEGIEENNRWLKKKLKEAGEEYKRATAPRKEIGRQVNLIQKQLGDRLKAECPREKVRGDAGPGAMAATVEAAKRCLDAFREGAIDTCQQSKELRARSFTLWRDAYHAWYAQVREPLERYYQVQGSWIRQLSSEQTWRAALLMRDAAVFTPLWTRMMEEDVERLGVAGMAAATFGLTAEACPAEPPAPVEPEEPPQLPKTDEPKRSCPLRPGASIKIPPADIPGLPLSFEITCESATMNLSAGLLGDDHVGPGGAAAVFSVTHNFGTDKSTTVFLGVQGSLTMDTAGAVSVGAQTQAGVAFTFDRNGQVTGAEGRLDFTTSAKQLEGWGGERSVGTAGPQVMGAVIELGPPEPR